MTEVILNESSNGIVCTDTSEYEWKPDNICEVDVGITCETIDGTPLTAMLPLFPKLVISVQYM